MSPQTDHLYADTINRAAMMLLAMTFRPKLKSSLIDEVIAAVVIRGGQIDGRWLIKLDLHDAFEAVVERAMVILSAALRERLPGIADEMDDAFGDKLRRLLGSIEHFFPTLDQASIEPEPKPAELPHQDSLDFEADLPSLG
jgi:hypothetical protein